MLPLAHVFGHCINLWLIAWGVSIYYFNDYKRLAEVCQEIKPTIMVVVPRLLEKVHAKMILTIHQLKGIRKTIGEWALILRKRKTLRYLRDFFLGLLIY